MSENFGLTELTQTIISPVLHEVFFIYTLVWWRHNICVRRSRTCEWVSSLSLSFCPLVGGRGSQRHRCERASEQKGDGDAHHEPHTLNSDADVLVPKDGVPHARSSSIAATTTNGGLGVLRQWPRGTQVTPGNTLISTVPFCPPCIHPVLDFCSERGRIPDSPLCNPSSFGRPGEQVQNRLQQKAGSATVMLPKVTQPAIDLIEHTSSLKLLWDPSQPRNRKVNY